MHIHRFKIDETERRAKEDVYHHMRRFLHIYDKEDGKDLFEGHLETIVKKPEAEFSARFHVGNAGSETPFDGHLTVLGTGLYWGVSVGRTLAQRLTTNKEYKYDGRDISVRVNYGRLWIRLWAPPDRWKRGEYPKWRNGSFALNPMEWIYGPLRYSYENLSILPATLVIHGDEEVYPITMTLQEQSYGRTKGKKKVVSYCVDVNAKKGIPDHYDRSGGWKGDRVYGFTVEVKNHARGWDIDALNLITAYILRNRGESGFREPQEVNL